MVRQVGRYVLDEISMARTWFVLGLLMMVVTTPVSLVRGVEWWHLAIIAYGGLGFLAAVFEQKGMGGVSL